MAPSIALASKLGPPDELSVFSERVGSASETHELILGATTGVVSVYFVVLQCGCLDVGDEVIRWYIRCVEHGLDGIRGAIIADDMVARANRAVKLSRELHWTGQGAKNYLIAFPI